VEWTWWNFGGGPVATHAEPVASERA